MNNHEVPYLEDNNRKGLTRGVAMFGDKHAQFELTPVGDQELSAIDHEEAHVEIAVNHMGELASRQALATFPAAEQISLEEFSRQHADLDQDRIDAMSKARTK